MTCTAADAAGNAAEASFEVTVGHDTTPPWIWVPWSVVADAYSPAGAVVDYWAGAWDDRDGPVPIDCSPPSGALFPVGVTTVHCTAVDAAGNAAEASFEVEVRDAAYYLAELRLILSWYTPPGSSLDDKLAAAEKHLAKGRIAQARSEVRSFIREVGAQTGKQLTDWQAYDLRTRAEHIIELLGG